MDGRALGPVGAVVALVAIGLGNGNRFSRVLVTVLTVVRLVAAGSVAALRQGTIGFWSALVAAGIAGVILGMLWNARASASLRTN